jgi:hypothetical protein
MEWLRPEIEDEFHRVENSIKKFMKKQHSWIEDINIDKESFQKNKVSSNALKNYDVSIVIDRKNLDMLRDNEEMLDDAQEQFELLFNSVVGSISSFDNVNPKRILVDVTPVIQDF